MIKNQRTLSVIAAVLAIVVILAGFVGQVLGIEVPSTGNAAELLIALGVIFRGSKSAVLEAPKVE